MSAGAAVTVPASFQCLPDSVPSLGIVPLWEFGAGRRRAWTLLPQEGWLIGAGSPPAPLLATDMEVMCAQGLCCDPAQPLETNCNNWVARPGLARGVTAQTKGTGNRHTASYAPSQP